MYMSMYIYGPGLGQQHLRKEGRPTAPMWGWVGGFGQGGGGGGGHRGTAEFSGFGEKNIQNYKNIMLFSHLKV